VQLKYRSPKKFTQKHVETTDNSTVALRQNPLPIAQAARPWQWQCFISNLKAIIPEQEENCSSRLDAQPQHKSCGKYQEPKSLEENRDNRENWEWKNCVKNYIEE
jgi:hypothetical protein